MPPKKAWKNALTICRQSLATIRTGRASVSILDHVQANYYGTPTPLNQMASLSTPDPTLIVIQPWDPSTIAAIEKAILTSDLGLNPTNDGKVVRLADPASYPGKAQAVGQIGRTHRRAASRGGAPGAP